MISCIIVDDQIKNVEVIEEHLTNTSAIIIKKIHELTEGFRIFRVKSCEARLSLHTNAGFK